MQKHTHSCMHTRRGSRLFQSSFVPQSTCCCLHSRNEIIHEAPEVTFPRERVSEKCGWEELQHSERERGRERENCTVFRLADEGGRRTSACLESKVWNKIRNGGGEEVGGRMIPCCIFISSVLESPWGWMHVANMVHSARTTCHLITLPRSSSLFLSLSVSSFHFYLRFFPSSVSLNNYNLNYKDSYSQTNSSHCVSLLNVRARRCWHVIAAFVTQWMRDRVRTVIVGLALLPNNPHDWFAGQAWIPLIKKSNQFAIYGNPPEKEKGLSIPQKSLLPLKQAGWTKTGCNMSATLWSQRVSHCFRC